jgi:hypothetical protein
MRIVSQKLNPETPGLRFLNPGEVKRVSGTFFYLFLSLWSSLFTASRLDFQKRFLTPFLLEIRLPLSYNNSDSGIERPAQYL